MPVIWTSKSRRGWSELPEGRYRLNKGHPAMAGVRCFVMWHHWLGHPVIRGGARALGVDMLKDQPVEFIGVGTPVNKGMPAGRAVWFPSGSAYIYSSSSPFSTAANSSTNMLLSCPKGTGGGLNSMAHAWTAGNNDYKRHGGSGADWRAGGGSRHLVLTDINRVGEGNPLMDVNGVQGGSGAQRTASNGVQFGTSSKTGWGFTHNRLAFNRLMRLSSEGGSSNWGTHGFIVWDLRVGNTHFDSLCTNINQLLERWDKTYFLPAAAAPAANPVHMLL